MKISAIKQYNAEPQEKITNSLNTPTTTSSYISQDKPIQKVYASNLGFRGNTQLCNLKNEYKRLINQDKVPAIESFLGLDSSSETMETLIKQILANEESSYEFIDSIITQPRKIKHYYKALQEKLPKTTDVFHFFMPDNLYKKAYANYLQNRINNASSISELLTLRPDWDETFLLNKHREIYHNDNFELGRVPIDIGAENYQGIIGYLRNYTDIGFKIKKNIPDLDINGRKFRFENFIDGKSDKNVFKITIENGKNYIIKIGNIENKALNQPFAIGALAMIDTYLTKNNCRNSAPIRYYDHNSNSVIYDFIEHNTTDVQFTTLKEFIEHMPDFTDLGLTQNDTVGSNNYFKLKENQSAMTSTYDFQYGIDHKEVISIDNDHVTYHQTLCPTDYHYNKPLPCAMQMFF